ncbi:MAG: YicC/YloC family endoribonuclease [Enterococcus sp.]
MKSMTGFGKAVQETRLHRIEVEVKSVNHRFLDLQLRTPKQINEFENGIRQVIKQHLQRGRVEVFVTLTEIGESQQQVQIQWPLVESLVSELDRGLKERFELTEFSMSAVIEQIISLPEFVAISQAAIFDEELEDAVLATVSQAVVANNQAREAEGVAIRQVLLDNHQLLVSLLGKLQRFVNQHEEAFRMRFEQKVQEYLGEQVDQERLLTEMVLLLERGDIHEELDRLKIHLQKMKQLFTQPVAVGRELDFLIQELNREINTVGSKSSPIEIKELVVQMKTTVEKIREQVQNIE